MFPIHSACAFCIRLQFSIQPILIASLVSNCYLWFSPTSQRTGSLILTQQATCHGYTNSEWQRAPRLLCLKIWVSSLSNLDLQPYSAAAASPAPHFSGIRDRKTSNPETQELFTGFEPCRACLQLRSIKHLQINLCPHQIAWPGFV